MSFIKEAAKEVAQVFSLTNEALKREMLPEEARSAQENSHNPGKSSLAFGTQMLKQAAANATAEAQQTTPPKQP